MHKHEEIRIYECSKCKNRAFDVAWKGACGKEHFCCGKRMDIANAMELAKERSKDFKKR
jgi:hypothetical protein